MSGGAERPWSRLRRALGAERPTDPDPAAGPVREAGPVEPTAIGPALDALVARARRNRRPRGEDPDYDLVADHFDDVTYLLQVPQIQGRADVDPVAHFLDQGADAVGQPDVSFSTRAYVERHPRIARSGRAPYVEWLREGRAAGRVGDPAPRIDRTAALLGLEPADLVERLAEQRADLQRRLRHGVLGEMIAKAAEIEPMIAATWPETTRPKLLPFVPGPTLDQMAVLDDCHRAAGRRRARVVIAVNRPRWGGGRRIEGHVAHALAETIDPADIVVIHTDESGATPPGRFPDGVREVDFAGAATRLGPAAAQRTLVELLRSLRADSVLVVNSLLLYDAMTAYGPALAQTERIVPVFFCNEQDAVGRWYGFPLRNLYRTWELTAGVVTDSEHFAAWLQETYQVPPADRDRFHVLRAPVDPAIPVAAAPEPSPGRRPTVFWAGRWDRQKRIDVVLEIARALPEVDFRMWGESVLAAEHALADIPANVHLQGPYAHFGDLDLSEADLWLYTSAWDGVPSLLLEVAMTGLPIVATVVGGTGEIVSAADGWPVEDAADPAAYVAAIRAILADPAAARARGLALRERMLAERTTAAYAEDVRRLLLRDPRRDEVAP